MVYVYNYVLVKSDGDFDHDSNHDRGDYCDHCFGGCGPAVVMSKRLLVSLLLPFLLGSFMLLGSFFNGSASQAFDTTPDTATASITAAPPPVMVWTVTGGVPSDFSCPTGLPVGWGTYTPDPLWNMMCGPCLEQITQTAYPTIVPSSPTVCPTIMVGGTPGFDCGLPTGTAEPTATIPLVCNLPTATALATMTAVPVGWTDVSYTGMDYVGSGWGVYDCGGGMCKLSNVTDDSWGYTFMGSEVKIYISTFNNAGEEEFFIDDSPVSTVDLYSNPNVNVHEVYDSGTLAYGSHRVSGRVTGYKNSSSTGYYVGISKISYLSGGVLPTPGLATVTCGGSDPDCTQLGTQHIQLAGHLGAHGGFVDTASDWYYSSPQDFQSTIVAVYSGTVESWFESSHGSLSVSLSGVHDVDISGLPFEFISVPDTPSPVGYSGGYGFTGLVAAGTRHGYLNGSVTGSIISGIDGSYKVDVYAYSTCMSWGSPTPGPGGGSGCSGGSYCDCVGPVDTGFGYTPPTYGATSCMDIGPFDWSSVLPTWLGGSVIPDIPWIGHVCFQDMDIGYVEIFSVYISIAAAVWVLAGVAMLIIIVTK